MRQRAFATFLSFAAILASAAAPATAGAMNLTSASIAEGRPVPARHVYNRNGCGGDDVSPDLTWAAAPAAAKSFAITVFDPDARGGRGWFHWLVFNIPPSVLHLSEGAGGAAIPGAVQSANDFGRAGYDGPCPPPGSGVHHYVFTVFALDVEKIALGADAAPAAVAMALKQHAIATARLTGVYER